ncbi:MAG: PD40 domain-containing protein, partial [Armatimonadetes bacterium]|nr:PD40 domain-containing protein [Armatimonadota bacterium]
MNRLGYCRAFRAMLCVVLASVTGGPLQAAISLGEPRPLSTAIERSEKPAVSPDGTRLAFISNRSGADNIWVMPLDGEPTQLTHETRPEVQTSNPRWSPAGDFLVYTSNKGGTGGFDLWVISADGQHDEPLTVDPALDWMPAWSPDGKRIAFVSDRDGADGLWLTNLDGSGVTKIADLAYEPVWSPDGSQLAAYHIAGQADGIFLLSPDGAAPPRCVLE